MVLRMKNFNILRIPKKIQLLGWFPQKKTKKKRAGLPKTGAWIVCRFKRAWQERVVWGFLVGGEIDTPMHTMLYVYVYFLHIFFVFY